MLAGGAVFTPDVATLAVTRPITLSRGQVEPISDQFERRPAGVSSAQEERVVAHGGSKVRQLQEAMKRV